AKPFTIFTKSSNILFSDCIFISPSRRGQIGPRAPFRHPRASGYPRYPQLNLRRAEQELDIALGPRDRARLDADHGPSLAFNPCLCLGADALMDGGIAHHPALPHPLASRLEPRLDP